MAEETKAEEATPVVEEESKDNGKNNRREFKRDETPVEELFDLTKPIPRVREPHDFSQYPIRTFLRNG